MPVLEGAQLRLEWSGGSGPFQLQEGAAPNGPWLNVGTAIDGTNTEVAILPPQRFFRVAGGSTGEDSGEQAMRATLLAVETFVNDVPTEDRPAWRTQVLNFLNGRADIDSAGETPDGVWAITTDGIPLALWNNRLPDPFDPEDLIEEAAVLRTQTPGNTAARFATTVGTGFTRAGPRLARQLSTHGYAPSFDSAPLNSLKGQRNESVFFFNTHGGAFAVPSFGADGKPQRGSDGKVTYEIMYGLWSGQKIDPRLTDPEYSHAEFISELQARRLALAFAPASYTTDSAGFQTAVKEWRFGITSEWVRHYMRFPKENHASIWLGACMSGSPGAAPIVIVHGLKSNIRRITRWTVNGTYKMFEPETPHVINGDLKLIFRADVGEYRKEPGNIFIRPTRSAVAAQNSEVRLEASGVVSEPCIEGGSETITWHGSGLFPTYDPTGPQSTHAVVSLNTIDQTGALGLAFGLRDPDAFPLKMTAVFCGGGSFTFALGLAPSGPVEIDPLLFGFPLEELLPDGTRYEYPLPGGSFAFGSDWAISAGSADSEIDSGMKWKRAEPEFPPDPDAAR